MSPEAKRKLKDAFDAHPEWTDVDGARRVDAFRRAARALVLGKDHATDGKPTTTPEQEAALLLCDRIADTFDPVLGGPTGARQDELWRGVAPFLRLGEDDVASVEERRARGVLVIEDWAGRFLHASKKARISTARAVIAGLSQVAHHHFERLQCRLDLVEDELVKYTPRCPPGRGKRNGTRIFAILCVESGAFIAGGDNPKYKAPAKAEAPAKKDRYDKLVEEQFEATRKAVKREYARWAHLKDRT